MTELWCKLWNFILNAFTSVIEGVGTLLSTVGTVLIEALGAVAEAAGDILGISGGSLIWLALGGIGLWFFLSQDDKSNQVKTISDDKRNLIEAGIREGADVWL